MQLPFEEQKQMLINKAKNVVDQIEGKVIADAGNVVNGIMAASAQKADEAMKQPIEMKGASEEELKAQAALKGSVGGVQGILELQKAVASGSSDKDSAVSILELVYGFSRSEAEEIIGNPKQVIPINPNAPQQ